MEESECGVETHTEDSGRDVSVQKTVAKTEGSVKAILGRSAASIVERHQRLLGIDELPQRGKVVTSGHAFVSADGIRLSVPLHASKLGSYSIDTGTESLELVTIPSASDQEAKLVLDFGFGKPVGKRGPSRGVIEPTILSQSPLNPTRGGKASDIAAARAEPVDRDIVGGAELDELAADLHGTVQDQRGELMGGIGTGVSLAGRDLYLLTALTQARAWFRHVKDQTLIVRWEEPLGRSGVRRRFSVGGECNDKPFFFRQADRGQ
jgi:hypothetical protein